ncbi:transcription factor bHLH167-like [Durio zibethinus]|uniref:Transcription factor bHLH167-like n=1 Tax=Durio zibethinus TaxID=66656 RepID=A0A6P5XG35_DURZI|nr:transcription factor bHLH167-like [Durio zibethinus]
MPVGSKSLSRMNRNLIERERRSQMKILFSKLFNLLPPHPTKTSIPEMVEHATVCISQLQKRMEELKQRKVQLEADHISPQAVATGTISPVIDITDLDSSMEVNLMAGTNTKFALCDIISILEEEGAQVLSATYHNTGNKILLSIHSQAAYSRIGIENVRVHERLKRLQIS